MIDPHFFGYGSLVNRNTHRYNPCEPATLIGWRRVWRHSTNRPVAILTAEPDKDCSIEGLIAPVPNSDWDELDLREIEYDRVGINSAVTHNLHADTDIQVYHIPEGIVAKPDLKPILLSYIDVVVQGYLREFGEAGVYRFFETTNGWDAPITDDRTNPIYPRHQELTAAQTAFVDALINQFCSD